MPTGQASWHFHDSQAYLFDGLPAYQGAWDGHDTPEKYRRLAQLPAPAAIDGAQGERQPEQPAAYTCKHVCERDSLKERIFELKSAASAQVETWKILPSPARVTGEILHQAFPQIPGEPWPLPPERKAVWERFVDRVNARLAATDDARDAARYRALFAIQDFCRDPLWPVVEWMRDGHDHDKALIDAAIDAVMGDSKATGEPIQEAKE